jgi:FkbM family methyltransferase
MKTDATEELDRWKQIAEEHAFSVRQVAAQRARHFEVLNLAGRIIDKQSSSGMASALAGFFGTSDAANTRIGKILQAVESSPSQFLQDIFCLLIARGKKDGFFVEFGACDGALISNTILLEREFGWRGILSEPAPSWHEKLRANRKCIIETRCVWSRSGEQLEFAELAGDQYMTQSGLSDTISKNETISKHYKVDTISLLDLLREHKAPAHIDMLSVDTEGSEFEILNAFPFGQYTFGFICVEHHTPEQELPIKALLESAGYTQILRNVSGHDGFYILKNAVV